MPKKTRKAIYEELRNMEELGSKEYVKYIAALGAFTEKMDEITERDKEGRQKPINKEQRSDVVALFNDLHAAYGKCMLFTSNGKWSREQEAEIRKNMQTMQQSASRVANQIKSYNPDKGLKTFAETLGLEKRAAKLHKLLGDKTSVFRGTSKNYQAVQRALETIKESGKAPTPEQLRAVKEAAERYKFEKEENIRDREKPANDYERARIDAVTQVLAFANEGLGLPATDNQMEAVYEDLDIGQKDDLGVQRIVEHYQPIPKVDPNSVGDLKKGASYTQEEFDRLEKLDVSKMRFIGKPIADKDFAAVSILATISKDVGGKYTMNPDLGVAPVEVEHPDIMLAVANISPYVLDIGNTDKVRMGCSKSFGEINNVGRKKAYEAFGKYQNGDKEPLAQLIGEGVKNMLELNGNFQPGKNKGQSLSRDQRMFHQFLVAASNMAKQDPELMALAEKHGLTQNTLKTVEGLDRMGKIQRMATRAGEKLMNNEALSKIEKEACITSILRWKSMDFVAREEVNGRKNTPEKQKMSECLDKSEELSDKINAIKDAKAEELGITSQDSPEVVLNQRIKEAKADPNANPADVKKWENELKDMHDKQRPLRIERSVQNNLAIAWQEANSKVPAAFSQLGGKGCLAQLKKQVNELIPNKTGLMQLSGKELVGVLKDDELIIKSAEAKEKYANIYNPTKQVQKTEPQKQQNEPGLTV